ncbi:hypothetical protein LCGC14_0595640 [marine sediment metagenome]|uniref:Ferritin-like diiron domain-containing protein n=1 Tax=marine sediment metagenome TaxID=412755 RepID=A0A0F9RC29_9ZZZZ|nr:MAG: Rubrerythrin-2 [Candidatus Lokiarchaeum sp. GC14_75]
MATTIENLKKAIIGESMAKRKYVLFAQKAIEQNLEGIAHLFYAVSFAESIHIKTHLKALSKISRSDKSFKDFIKFDEEEIKRNVGNTENNLIDAISGETFEFKKMYKSFIKNAKKEDIYLAEYSFDLARKAEIVHSQLFKKYLEKLSKHEIFQPIEIYVCSICGHVELRNHPKICPICGHDEKFFKKIDLE